METNPASRPPNLIFITSDEMRGDAPSFMGNPDCRTPCLDRFAENSTRFRHHFAVHSKCMPSRISMLTGRYTHTDGFRTVNKTNLLPPGAPNLLTVLKRAGYEAASFGHNHKWANMYDDGTGGSSCVDYHSYTKGLFDDVFASPLAVPDPGPDATPVIPVPDSCPELGVQRVVGHDNNRGASAIATQALRYLHEVRDRTRPCYLQVDFGLPHPPYHIEEPYFSMYDRKSITPFVHDIGPGAPLHLRKMRLIRSAGATEEILRQNQAVYYGMCTGVDALIGQVLDAIAEQGLMENSIVIFTSDHGDFAGQYGLPEKWDTAMNDCLLHVPCLMRVPGQAGGRDVEALSEHTDLAPTLLALLGLEANWLMHGESLLGVLDGQAGKEAVFANGGHEAAMRARYSWPLEKPDSMGRMVPTREFKQLVYSQFPDTMARAKMVRTDRWKLVVRETGGNELYDMKADPNEMENLWDRPDHGDIVRDLMLKLLNWCLSTDTDLPYQPVVGA